MNRILSSLRNFFGGDHRYRRYGGIGLVAGAPLAYGITRLLRGRSARRSSGPVYTGPTMG